MRKALLALRARPGERQGQHIFEWVGKWPPPDELLVVREKGTSLIKVVERSHQPAGWIEHFQDNEHYEVLEFALNQAHDLPERRAEYVVKRTQRKD